MFLLRFDEAVDPRVFWAEAYSTWAETSPEAVRLVFGASALHRLAMAELPEAGRILDAGSGIGVVGLLNDRPARTVVGIDTSAGQLDAARRLAPGGEHVLGSIDALPFADRSFDGYVSLSVYEFLLDGPATALAEAARVLAPGGRLVIATQRIPALMHLRRRGHVDTTMGRFRFERWSLGRAAPPDAYGLYYTEAELLRAARGAGFVDVRVARRDLLGGMIHAQLLGRLAGARLKALLVARAPGALSPAPSPSDRAFRELLLDEEGPRYARLAPLYDLAHRLYGYWNVLVARRA